VGSPLNVNVISDAEHAALEILQSADNLNCLGGGMVVHKAVEQVSLLLFSFSILLSLFVSSVMLYSLYFNGFMANTCVWCFFLLQLRARYFKSTTAAAITLYCSLFLSSSHHQKPI